MASPIGIEYPGALYHLTPRGNARNDIYLGGHDRQNYLSIPSEVVKRYNWLGIYNATVSRVVRKVEQEM